MGRDNKQRLRALLPGRSPTRTSEGTLPLRPGSSGNWMAWTALLASLLITFVIWYLARGVAMERGHDRFVFQVHTIESALHERLRAYESLLRGGAGLFAASGEVTRAEWRRYINELQIDKYYQGVQGIGFSKRILPSEKETHIRQIREEGFPNYDIQPDGERPEYTSIVFLEPFDWRNQRAFGYDMFSEPTRKEAMVKARDTGLAAASAKVTLLQETDKDVQAGFLMYMPVYRQGEPQETAEQRREALTGYVYSPFRMNDFMRGILMEKHGHVELQIFDGDEPLEEALLYHGGDVEKHLSLSQSDRPHFATHQSFLEYAGRRWLLVFVSSRHFEETMDTGPVNVILLLGITISLLLFAVVLSLTKSRNQALSLGNMSLDLERANLELKKEIEENILLASFPKLNPSPVIELDPNGNVSYLNPAAEKVFPELAAQGKLHPLLHDSAALIAALRQGEQQEETTTEATIGEATYELHISYVQNANLIHIYGINITERKRQELELREKEHILSESQRLGHIGSFLFDMAGTLQWSEELYRLYGVSPDTFTPTVESFLGLIHPDDREAMQESMAAGESGENLGVLDFRINKPDGTMRYVRGWGEVVLDIENRPIYVAGIVQDITERKRAEEKTQQYVAKLAESNKELQAALADIKQLTGMLPICASCKKIRDDKGYWQGVESYITQHSEAVFTHGICPECEKKMYEELEKLQDVTT